MSGFVGAYIVAAVVVAWISLLLFEAGKLFEAERGEARKWGLMIALWVIITAGTLINLIGGAK